LTSTSLKASLKSDLTTLRENCSKCNTETKTVSSPISGPNCDFSCTMGLAAASIQIHYEKLNNNLQVIRPGCHCTS